MKAITLGAWAGEQFSFAHGDLIDMPAAMAGDRIAAGIARLPTDEEAASLPALMFPGFEGDPVIEPIPQPLPLAAPRRPRDMRGARKDDV